MNQTMKNVLARIKNIDPSDAIYGGILIVFFIIVVTTFVVAVRFISSNINAIFTEETGGSGLGLNKERYGRIIEKLGITVPPPSLPQMTERTPVPEPEAPVTTVAPPPLDRGMITLMIKNSTAKKGAANTLAAALQKEGFVAAKTENEARHYATTTIIIKERFYEYASLFLEEVTRSYSDAIATSTANTAPYDVTIIIGEK